MGAWVLPRGYCNDDRPNLVLRPPPPLSLSLSLSLFLPNQDTFHMAYSSVSRRTLRLPYGGHIHNMHFHCEVYIRSLHVSGVRLVMIQGQ